MRTIRLGELPISERGRWHFMRTSSTEDEELMRKLDNLMKDPAKWKEYIESRADKAIKNWPTR